MGARTGKEKVSEIMHARCPLSPPPFYISPRRMWIFIGAQFHERKPFWLHLHLIGIWIILDLGFHNHYLIFDIYIYIYIFLFFLSAWISGFIESWWFTRYYIVMFLNLDLGRAEPALSHPPTALQRSNPLLTNRWMLARYIWADGGSPTTENKTSKKSPLALKWTLRPVPVGDLCPVSDCDNDRPWFARLVAQDGFLNFNVHLIGPRSAPWSSTSVQLEAAG